MDEEQMERLASLCFNKLKQQDGRAIDDAFIKTGFVGVQAEIDLLTAVFGRDSYESLLWMYSSEENRREVSRRVERIRDTFSECKSRDGRSVLASRLIAEPGIPGESKYSVLRRYVPDLLDELFIPHMPVYHQRLQEQAQMICKSFPPPSENLRPLTMTTRRKQIFNAVASEVFTDLGFSSAGRKRGLVTYAKRLDERFSIRFNIDHTSFESDHSLAQNFPSRYWGGIGLDYHLNVIHHDGRKETEIMGFGVQESVAAARLRSYDGSCSLEIAIRGYGLWYEFAAKPIEKLLLETE